MFMRKIYEELVLIRKGLQSIRRGLESDSAKKIARGVAEAINEETINWEKLISHLTKNDIFQEASMPF